MVHVLDTAPFASVAPRPRRDGWTPAVQHAFIAAIAVGGSVSDACRHVGRSRKSAYAMRQRDDAAGFAAAWDDAISGSEEQLVDGAVERCIDGLTVPVFYRGRNVGERSVYDNRLLMFMLRRRELSAARRRTRTDIITKPHPALAHDSECV
jgi:hypothetical protein